jgi:hypothetical protein
MALLQFRAKSMENLVIASPYFEDEDVGQIVIKPLPKYTRHRAAVR